MYRLSNPLLIAPLLALAACGGAKDATSTLDADLLNAAGNGSLADQIVVDPARTARKTATPATPHKAPDNAFTLGEMAQLQQRTPPPPGGCEPGLKYGAGWEKRLPPGIALYPGAKISEAAGNDLPGCEIRIVSFSVAAPLATVRDWYRTQAARSGFTADDQIEGPTQILAGTRPRDDGAYYLELSATPGGGTAANLMANNRH